MADLASLESNLKTFLVDQLFVDLPAEEIGSDMALGTEVGVDSLGFTEIVAYLEDSFGVKVTDAEFTPENFRTIASIVALVRAKTQPLAA